MAEWGTSPGDKMDREILLEENAATLEIPKAQNAIIAASHLPLMLLVVCASGAQNCNSLANVL